MSTIVKYKDNTLTTIENSKKTIKTANKWMEDNLTLIKTDSSNPLIYQDEDGYLVINKDGNSSGVETVALNIAANGIYDAGTGKAYNQARVRVPVSNIMKSIIDRSVTSITNSDLPKVTTLGYSAFSDCINLTSITLDDLTSIGDYCFMNCSSLSSFHGKSVSYLGQYAFQGSGIITFVSETPITGGIYNALYGAAGLEKIDLSYTNSFSNGFFRCAVLNTLVLRNNTICKLSGIGAFQSSPFASGGTGGTLYVPSALISSYQSATNWSTILGYENNKILPIEGSIYETKYADGILIGN